MKAGKFDEGEATLRARYVMEDGKVNTCITILIQDDFNRHFIDDIYSLASIEIFQKRTRNFCDPFKYIQTFSKADVADHFFKSQSFMIARCNLRLMCNTDLESSRRIVLENVDRRNDSDQRPN